MSVDFGELFRLWDLQQDYYMKYRNERFSAMLDILEISQNPPYRLLDLASGTGSLSTRFLERFPDSETVMMDQDPVLLRISRENFRNTGSKHSWIDGDISAPENYREIAPQSLDAVMSTTALHWLSEDAFSRVLKQCFLALKPGGIFLNGDHIHSTGDSDTFNMLEDKFSNLHRKAVYSEDIPDWDGFWKLVSEISELSEEFRQRNVLYPPGWTHGKKITLERQTDFLRKAGFEVPGIVWSSFSDRILMAIKP